MPLVTQTYQEDRAFPHTPHPLTTCLPFWEDHKRGGLTRFVAFSTSHRFIPAWAGKTFYIALICDSQP